ncbi:MAG: hypothetical protein OXF01_02230 [Gemmatimonadetes bacterium]|nr:hypothetical protein [Gemmatimonadota bacterium]
MREPRHREGSRLHLVSASPGPGLGVGLLEGGKERRQTIELWRGQFVALAGHAGDP